MGRRTTKKTPKKAKKAKVKWYNDWVKMAVVLLLGGAAAVALGVSCVRFTAESTLNILGALLAMLGGLCILGTVGLIFWRIGDQILLRRVSCPKCHARNKIPRRLRHYQCSECGRRVRL